MSKTKVIVVVGPTASGKTDLGVYIAKKYNGEVISADSMQIYKNMDIATAKPTISEMDGIKHHLIGFLEPKDEYSVASFCEDAKNVAEEITAKGKIPVIVGGTGLYIDSFINNITFFENTNSKKVREELNKELEQFGIEKLYNELREIDACSAEKIHPNNTLRVIRALEVYRLTGKTLTEQNEQSLKNESPFEPLYIGITYNEREKLYDRINRRVDIMLENGLLEEAEAFYKNYPSQTAVNAIGYKELKPFIDTEKSLEECVESLKQATRKYAKRQLTWFNRNEKINWFYKDLYNDADEFYKSIDTIINKFLKGE